jgi:hypothetical protein
VIKEGLGGIDILPIDRPKLETQINELIFNNSQLTNGKQAEAAKHFSSVFKSVRDIIKFSNSFLLTLSLNKDDLYVPDLYILELIKIVNSDLYHFMASTGKYLIVNSTGSRQEYSLYITPANQCHHTQVSKLATMCLSHFISNFSNHTKSSWNYLASLKLAGERRKVRCGALC